MSRANNNERNIHLLGSVNVVLKSHVFIERDYMLYAYILSRLLHILFKNIVFSCRCNRVNRENTSAFLMVLTSWLLDVTLHLI